jgi:anti-sigma B factor antagonist
MTFFSAVALHPPHVHLIAKGELDAFAARSLRMRLEHAVDHGCINITVDARAVTFVDAGGLGMFVGLVNTVAPYGGGVTIEAASDRFLRVAEVAGLRNAFELDLLPDGPGHHRAPGRRSAMAS